MSAVGFDLSSDTCRVAIIPPDNIYYQVVTNRHGEFGTPAAVCFDGTRRFIGKDAISGKSCFPHIMKIIGRSMSDIEFDPELSHWLVKDPISNLLLVAFPDLDEQFRVTPTQVLAMVISDLKYTAERALGVTVKVCCIGIRSYFTRLKKTAFRSMNFKVFQRTAVRQAAEIAGLSEVFLVNATTATAISHGINRKLILQQDTDHYVAFVDVGKAVMQVSIVKLGKNSVEVLSYVYDSSTAKKDFVHALASHFQKTDCNAGSIRDDPEKLEIKYNKGKAPTNMYDGKEITASMFTEICGPILNRMKAVFKKALSQANVEIEETGVVQEKVINGVVLTGPGVQIFAIHNYLRDVFEQTPCVDVKFADECVAKGCAIQCAIRSVNFIERTGAPRNKHIKDGLVNCKVIDDVALSVKNSRANDRSSGC